MNIKYHWPLIGHTQLKDYLQKQINSNTLPHALLFSGPDQIGKFSLAVIFAKSILCNSKDKIPCEKCINCRQVNNGTSGDFIIVKKEEEKIKIAINQIRDLQQKLSLKSFDTKHKIIIIDNAEDLSEEASNALLKTLEEPFPKTIFIIVTSKIEFISSTIKSRCQILNFNLLPTFQIDNWLLMHNLDKKNAKIISNTALGKPGLALKYLENNNLIKLQKEQAKLLIDLLKIKNITEKFSMASTYLGKPTNSEVIDLLNNWEQLVRDITLIKFNNNISNLSYISSIKLVSKNITLKKLFKYYQLIKNSKVNILNSINAKLVLENLIIQL